MPALAGHVRRASLGTEQSREGKMARAATARGAGKPKAEAKMKPSASPVEEHIELLEPAARREDARTLDEMMRRVTGKPPVLWAGSIVGYGRVHYVYETGHEGDMPEAAFAARK